MLPNSQKQICKKFNMFPVMLFSSAQHRGDEMGHMSKNGKWGGCREAIEQKQRQKWEVPLWKVALRRQSWCQNLNLGTLVAA